MRCIDADSLAESLLDCPVDEEVALENAEEAGLKENDDTVIIDFWRRCKDSFVNFIKTQPTIDPVKHAHWIRVARSESEYWQCSNCHGYFTLPMPKYRGFYMRYCGCCGAEMDEVAE